MYVDGAFGLGAASHLPGTARWSRGLELRGPSATRRRTSGSTSPTTAAWRSPPTAWRTARGDGLTAAYLVESRGSARTTTTRPRRRGGRAGSRSTPRCASLAGSGLAALIERCRAHAAPVRGAAERGRRRRLLNDDALNQVLAAATARGRSASAQADVACAGSAKGPVWRGLSAMRVVGQRLRHRRRTTSGRSARARSWAALWYSQHHRRRAAVARLVWRGLPTRLPRAMESGVELQGVTKRHGRRRDGGRRARRGKAPRSPARSVHRDHGLRRAPASPRKLQCAAVAQ